MAVHIVSALKRVFSKQSELCSWNIIGFSASGKSCFAKNSGALTRRYDDHTHKVQYGRFHVVKQLEDKVARPNYVENRFHQYLFHPVRDASTLNVSTHNRLIDLQTNCLGTRSPPKYNCLLTLVEL